MPLLANRNAAVRSKEISQFPYILEQFRMIFIMLCNLKSIQKIMIKNFVTGAEGGVSLFSC